MVCISSKENDAHGKLIYSQIQLIINNINLALYFLTIITELCAKDGFEFHDYDELLQQMKAIDDAYWKSKFEKRRADFLDVEPTGSG